MEAYWLDAARHVLTAIQAHAVLKSPSERPSFAAAVLNDPDHPAWAQIASAAPPETLDLWRTDSRLWETILNTAYRLNA